MSRLSTHVLDTSVGLPARGVAVALDRRGDDGAWQPVAHGVTDDDGRLRLVDDQRAALVAGVHRLTFDTGAYFASRGTPTFFPSVALTFEIEGAPEHQHVPLLLAPFAYSTYRGS
jgi:5-hydroxyisourate hydrolase